MIYNISEIRVGAANISSGYVGGNIVWPNAPAGNPIIAYFTDLSGNRYPAKNPDGYLNPNELSSDTLASLPTGHTWYQLDTTSACTSIGTDWAVAERANETIAVVNLAQGLQEIHQGAFGDFWYLTGITIPEGVYYVGGGAFEGCSGLTSVTLPNSLRTLSDRTFVGCQNLSAVTMPNALADIGGHVFADCTSLSSITIPNTVVQIGNDVGEEEGDDGYTFVNCPLTSVTIPASVQYIAEYSFGNLTNLEWVEFKGTTPPQHGSDVFYNIENIPIYVPCSALDAYKQQWSEYATLFECKEEPFEGKARLTLSNGDKVIIPGSGMLEWREISTAYTNTTVKVEIGSACTAIGGSTFMGFRNITSVTISDSVTAIWGQAFESCTSLTSIVIPDSVETIWGAAFLSATSLSSVTLGSGLTTIGESGNTLPGPFTYCTSLKSIVIPDNVTTIGRSAFVNCTGLTSVTIGSGVTTWYSGAFFGCSSLSSVTLTSGLTSIGEDCFAGCTSLSSVSIPDSITTIAKQAFDDSGLLSITIPSGVTRIENATFHGCINLTSVTIPDSVTYIGNSSFSGCTSLSSVTIPSGVTEIDTGSFEVCTGLTGITIEAITPPEADMFTFRNTNNCPIYVPAESVDAYKAATNWSSYASRIQAIP